MNSEVPPDLMLQFGRCPVCTEPSSSPLPTTQDAQHSEHIVVSCNHCGNVRTVRRMPEQPPGPVVNF